MLHLFDNYVWTVLWGRKYGMFFILKPSKVDLVSHIIPLTFKQYENNSYSFIFSSI